MYLIKTLYYLYKKEKRETLLNISKRLADETKKSQVYYIFDMIRCSLVYGAMFTEYGDLDFAYRSAENRKTILTTFYNFKVYDKINSQEYRNHFHEKVKFLKAFSALIRRDWINIPEASDEQLNNFLAQNPKMVLKKSYGDSGNEVKVHSFAEGVSAQAFREFAAGNHFDMAEQFLVNHRKLAYFNETSLNTVRITTVQLDGKVEFLFAGLRVGAKGCDLDNISQGGAVAAIDLETGKLKSGFATKRSSASGAEIAENAIGYQLPYWEEVKALAEKAALVIPQIGFVSWDICITEDGPEIIEGNESFGSVIMQLACSPAEPGLKPMLNRILSNGKVK